MVFGRLALNYDSNECEISKHLKQVNRKLIQHARGIWIYGMLVRYFKSHKWKEFANERIGIGNGCVRQFLQIRRKFLGN